MNKNLKPAINYLLRGAFAFVLSLLLYFSSDSGLCQFISHLFFGIFALYFYRSIFAFYGYFESKEDDDDV